VKGICAKPGCPCQRPLSPWAQEIVDQCKAEGRRATDEEQAVLVAELFNLGDAAIAALDAP
jgi:hypothetical protein